MRNFSFVRILATASIAMLAGASPAFAAEPQSSFTLGSDTYVYSVSDDADKRVISGKRYPGGSDFRLVVRNGKVAGSVDGQTVGFRVAEAKGAAAGATKQISMR